MSYTAVSDFKFGMDRRRPQTSGVPGTLWILKNALITRGGDIERAKKFAAVDQLPAGTFALFSVREQRYVFGSGSTPVGMPTGVRYQQLAAPGSPAMIQVLDAKGFSGKVYAIASYADGNVYHFYNGARVTQWDGLADAAADYESVAARLAQFIDAQGAYKAKAFGNVVEIQAAVAGIGYTIASSATDNGSATTPTATHTSIQANVAPVAEVRATGTITITGGSQSADVNMISSVIVDSVELLDTPVDWFDSNNATANALAVEINNTSSTHGYTASAAGAVVTLQAAVGTGTAPNGDAITVVDDGDVTTSTAAFSGGVAAVAAVAQLDTVTISGGTFDALDLWKITLAGVDYQTTGRASATGTSALVSKSRVYSLAGSLIRYCKINDATDWTDATLSSGAGFINVSNEVEGAEVLVGAAKYNDLIAIFARNSIITYSLMADAQESSIVQPIDNTGTIAPRSLVAYGANDVYYLDETGVRSLRTRDTYNAAYASDVGSAIDPFVQQLLDEVGADVASKACAVIEPRDGRYMLALGRYLLVLSNFPSSKITAWSYIDFGAVISDLVRVGRNIYLRSGDTIYAYGGADGTVYPDADEFPILAEMPFISSKDPAGLKELQGFDMAGVNTWRVQLLPDPENAEHFSDVGFIKGTTYHKAANKVPGETSHFSLRFTCSAAGYASLSSTAVHHSAGEKQ